VFTIESMISHACANGIRFARICTLGEEAKDFMRDELGVPKTVDRSTFQAELDALRIREKAHTSFQPFGFAHILPA
jgi:hypothetical protein